MRFLPAITMLCLAAGHLHARPDDPDTDGDGLSDFQERHKYFTDPARQDSDGDGKPDGDWDERREYSYTVRSIVQVMRPVTPDAISNDDYQDARVLDETDAYFELEVIHYPLNTVGEAITANPGWRKDYQGMKEYLAPRITANWDERMRREMIVALKADGIDVANLDDKETVERVSRWLMQRAKYHDGFTTFLTHFPEGRAAVLPGLEAAAENGRRDKGLTLDQQWDRELFARGMFFNRTRGSCTSSSIYLNGCLRAVGIPTRIVLCIPVVDASDAREVEFVRRRLTNHRVRATVEKSVQQLRGSWASHTFNEVYVGGRWRRLNYERLGQNILDEGCLGLMTHVATLADWSDARAAFTIGRRQKTKRGADDPFGHSNPYSTITLSDRFGAHCRIKNDPPPKPQEFKTLTILEAFWYHSPKRTRGVSMRLRDPETAGHVLMRVKESRGAGVEQYQPFYTRVAKGFVLRAAGRPDVAARAARGYWGGAAMFYLRIEPAHLKRMDRGVPYRLVALNGNPEYSWVVVDGVTLTRE